MENLKKHSRTAPLSEEVLDWIEQDVMAVNERL